MKIAVISDSHYQETSVNALKNYLKDVDMLIHCGDGAPDLKNIENFFKGEMYGVRGNCDISREYPTERIVEVDNKKILVCHGHKYNVKTEYNTIYYKAKELGVDIVLFGHSHNAIILRHDGITLMNPGSVSLPYGKNKKTLGFIELTDEKEGKIYLRDIEI